MLMPSPLRVAVLCSHRAPGLAHLLTRAANRGRDWDVVCCLSSEETFEDERLARQQGVAVLSHPVRRFYQQRDPQAKLGDMRIRDAYDRRSVELLQEHRPGLVILAGYLLLLTRPMLVAFENRILNVHHSDLLLRDASGRPRYPGLRAVRDAILAGEPETRSTLHLVTERLDDGPPLLRSKAFPVPEAAARARVTGAADLLRRAIWTHQEWMLQTAFGPLMEQALDLVSAHEPLARVPAERAS